MSLNSPPELSQQPGFADHGNASQVTSLQSGWKPFDVWPLYLNFSVQSVWSSPLMTDETVGPELPAATGGWTNGRARSGASIRNRLLRPGRMLSGGREWARALPDPSIP